MTTNLTDLQQRIRKEMMVDYSSALEKNFEIAKQLVRFTPEGRVDVIDKEQLTGTQQILLYLIGKLYASEAQSCDCPEVGNDELLKELGIPKGSLLPWLKQLRDSNQIKSTKKGKNSFHSIMPNVVERTLKSLKNLDN